MECFKYWITVLSVNNIETSGDFQVMRPNHINYYIREYRNYIIYFLSIGNNKAFDQNTVALKAFPLYSDKFEFYFVLIKCVIFF